MFVQTSVSSQANQRAASTRELRKPSSVVFHIYDVIKIPTRPGILSTETVFTLVLNNMQ